MLATVNGFNYHNNFLNFKALQKNHSIVKNSEVTSPSTIQPKVLGESVRHQNGMNSANMLANYNKAFIKFKGGESTGSIGYLTKSSSESAGSIGKRK